MDLGHIPAIDQHAHNVLSPAAAAKQPFAAAFTEAGDAQMLDRFARKTLCYRRSLRDIAELLDCAATEEAILTRRCELSIEQLTKRCFDAAHLDAVFLDDGYQPELSQPTGWHGQFATVRRILRVERLVEELLAQVNSFGEFKRRLEASLDPPPPGVVAFKTIAAYRIGLAAIGVGTIRKYATRVTLEDLVESRFKLHKTEAREKRLRLTDANTIEFALQFAFASAAKHGIPIQFHTGFGDTDLDLSQANPLLLRPLLENPQFRDVRIVLLHASYPFVREAGYLASVYPQVYLDFGLAVPFLSVAGMRLVLAQLLELAPTDKLMYASDAHFIPELFYLGAKWGRNLLAELLEDTVGDGDLTYSEAEEAARAILGENARRLYRLA
jgi:predicted TIM-barrel fold metal-dependent hydrolase